MEAEFVTHPFMSVIEALLFAMRLQQQCDFVIISAVYNVYIGDGMIIVLSVSTLLFVLSGIYPFSTVNPGCFIRMN